MAEEIVDPLLPRDAFFGCRTNWHVAISCRFYRPFLVDEFPKSLLILNLKGNPCTRLPDYRISLIRVLPRLRQLDDADVSREEKVRAGLEVSEDEEEEEDEDEDELQKKKGIRDIDIKDVATRILVRSQHRLEKHMESHKKYGGGIYEVRGQTTGQSSLPPSAHSVKSSARSLQILHLLHRGQIPQRSQGQGERNMDLANLVRESKN